MKRFFFWGQKPNFINLATNFFSFQTHWSKKLKKPKKSYMSLLTFKTLCNNFKNCRLKHVNMSSKIISLQCSWFQKFYDENFHERKIILSHLMNKYFWKPYKFHSWLSFDCKLLIKFPGFYKTILFQWSSSLRASSNLLSWILSNLLWFNKHILIE